MALFIVGLIVLIIAFLGIKKGTNLSRYRSLIITAGFLLLIIGFLMAAVKQINAGHVGVMVIFGQVQPNVIYEGLSLVNPIADVKEISIQTENYTMSGTSTEGQKAGDDAIRVLSKDGLEVILDLTVLYKIVPSDAPRIYRDLGLDFEDKIVRPLTRTGIRESASYFDAIDLFSERREEFEDKIRQRIEGEMKARGFILEQLLVRNINLPTSVKESIERKITAVQDAQRMKFVLEKEQQEAERKRVEAHGVADAQKIVNEGLSDKILQFEMIKVQKELATSPNSKVIIMGGGKSSPPFIIGNEK